MSQFLEQLLNNPLYKLILESNLINFSILVIALGFALTKLIPDSTRQRKLEIEAEIAAAEKVKKEAEDKLKELQQEIKRSQAEAERVISSAKDTAESVKEKIVAEAKLEIDRLHHNTEKEMKLQKELVIDNIKSQIANLAMNEIEKNLQAKQVEVDALIQTRLKKDLLNT